ncbi:Na+/H+ antiporter subunit B [Pontibacter saemangeumensis]|uniref:Na+/H+ antiporter subunit B n=1 Tax=Pontibacter saemangeumensis TaxID=1084525 RepID=A0ABP8LDF3_9BACT
MRTIIFSTAIRLLTPVFLLFSVYILIRGHNHPGGGFIGGLIGAIAFVFHVLAHGANATSRVFFSLTFYFYPRQAGHSRTRYAMQILNANIRNRKNSNQPHQWNFVFLHVRPVYLMGLGLLLAVTSGTFSLVLQKPFMTGIWIEHEIPIIGALGTPLLFDIGVYLLVMGMVLKLVFSMSKE